MSESRSTPPARPSGVEEQDILFRAQMGVVDFVLGNWRRGVALVGVILVIALVYGLYTGHVRETQQGWQAELGAVDRKLPEPDPLSRYGLAPADDPKDAARMKSLEDAAREYEAIGAQANGAAAAMAWLRAAETWNRAHKADEAALAYEKANAVGASGMLGYAALTGLANSKASKGDVDGAAALYKAASAKGTDFAVQRALLDLGLLYESAGRKEDAARVFEEFNTRFADSTLAEDVAAASGRLREGT